MHQIWHLWRWSSLFGQNHYILKCRNVHVHSKSTEMNLCQERTNARGLSQIAKLLRYDSILDFYSSDESLTLFRLGGAQLLLQCAPPPVTILRIRTCICKYTHQFFLTIPHFDSRRGCNTFGHNKFHHFARKIKSWSILHHLHSYEPHRPPKKVTFSEH